MVKNSTLQSSLVAGRIENTAGTGSLAKSAAPQIYLSVKKQGYRDTLLALSAYDTAGVVMVKLEMNTILRGSVFPGKVLEARGALAERLNLELYVTGRIMSGEDIYAGKICAALDRQHPRDLFDILILYENEGITARIRKAFVIYLASGDRPMHELLSPKRADMRHVFETEFAGMTDRATTWEELTSTRERLIADIAASLTIAEKKFLVSLKQGAPQWDLMDLPGIETLPAIQWKLSNIQKMDIARHKTMVDKLKMVLEME